MNILEGKQKQNRDMRTDDQKCSFTLNSYYWLTKFKHRDQITAGADHNIASIEHINFHIVSPRIRRIL